jgi:hypothetical protein
LLLVLALAGDKRLGLARTDLFARIWSVARVRAAMIADRFGSTTGLGAWRCSIFALARTVTFFLAKVNPTFKLLSAW